MKLAGSASGADSGGDWRDGDRRRRFCDTRGELAADGADDQTDGGGDAEPTRRDAPASGLSCFGPGLTRERNDACRLIELLEPAKDLGLLGGEPLLRKRLVGGFDGRGLNGVEPTIQLHRSRGADVAAIEVEGTVAAHDGVDERPL